MKKLLLMSILFSLTLLTTLPVYAHTTSTSYLNINLSNETISGMWQVTLKDINLVLGLDLNGDSKLTWSEITKKKQSIEEELNKSIEIIIKDKLCSYTIENLMIDRRVSNVYLAIPFTTNCQSNTKLSITYNFLFEQDSFHKTILNVTKSNKTTTAILSYSNRKHTYDEQHSNKLEQFANFIFQGIIHVLIGLDHVLFVICLLLSATLFVKYNNQHHQMKPLLNNTFKLITAFTVAHSITLILASTKILSISPTIIEPVIAFSVIVLALLNLAKNNIKQWPIVFIFGLIHGFGFAFVLNDVSVNTMHPTELITSLFGFNIGVEIGQLIIVFSLLPILYFLNKKTIYHQFVIPISSAIIAFVGLVWLIERTTDFNNIVI